ncbi:MAG: YkgJ family cysteine cluster protein [Crocinitomicaceae bacterium]
MKIITLQLQDILPLTCTRAGTCCHGNRVMLNPWELFCLAQEKKITTKEFRERFCDLGGIQLRFNGPTDSKGKSACSQYIDGFGCGVHVGRPLACRLFPLGRQIQNNQTHYIHEGSSFPCLEGCPDVAQLPNLRVEDYLKGQATKNFEIAQDDYLELMQNLADLAFELLLETGLAASGDTQTLALWRKMGKEAPEDLTKRIGPAWLDYLMIPEISSNAPRIFVQEHHDFLQLKAQEQFGHLQTNHDFHEASVLLMALALQLARSIGADPTTMANHWCETAKNFGALEA